MKMRKIPYGLTDYLLLRNENYYYVDKTRFIREIEKSPRYLFMIRPRRFGKSLWLAVMACYYDIKYKDRFEEIFKGTYIYDNPTNEKNSYFILKFNFSEVCPDIDRVEESFNQTIKFNCLDFIRKYSEFIGDWKDKYNELKGFNSGESILKYIISLIKSYGKLYIMIDEYDNFTNTILSTQGKERYTAITHGEGFFRHFFNVLKAGTTGEGAAISKLFITGVSPVTMDDVTSGFNIGSNVTTDSPFNEMVGFSEEEVIEMLNYYIQEGRIKDTCENLIGIMKGWYDNYLFSQDCSVRMYNSDMVLYFIEKYILLNKMPQEMVDHNVKIDYGKLRYLILADIEGTRRANGNFEKLKYILQEKVIKSDLVTSFPVSAIIEPVNFISLLYYTGLLTIKGIDEGMVSLIIPNETIRKLYYEYIMKGYKDTNIFNLDLLKLSQLFSAMAYRGKWEDLLDYLGEEMKKQTAVRDYIDGEKAIQTFLRVYLSFPNYYITKTEAELNLGYSDILMLPNLPSYPDMKFSFLFEIKYIKVSEFTEELLEKKIKDAEEWLQKYGEDHFLFKQIGSTKLIKAILVFCGAELKCRK
jgi:hypothetical protein